MAAALRRAAAHERGRARLQPRGAGRVAIAAGALALLVG